MLGPQLSLSGIRGRAPRAAGAEGGVMAEHTIRIKETQTYEEFLPPYAYRAYCTACTWMGWQVFTRQDARESHATHLAALAADGADGEGS